MVTAIRNLGRYIWVNVPNMNPNEIDPEKLVAFDLLAGFVIATKHYLREEDGTEFSGVRLDIQPMGKLKDADNKARLNKILSRLQGYRKKPTLERQLTSTELVVNYNLPLEIAMYLNYYISQLKKRQPDTKRPDDMSITQMYLNVATLVDCLTSLERVLRSPIPLAYAIHLLQTTWIFCLSLPFQLVADLEWVTLPIVFLASVILLGVEEIAREIENPFGTDPNDLALDDFCEILRMELNFVKGHEAIEDQWKKSTEKKLSDIKGVKESEISVAIN
ncbi:3083_t:CDS:1, partial [Cetraspora pellucida]